LGIGIEEGEDLGRMLQVVQELPRDNALETLEIQMHFSLLDPDRMSNWEGRLGMQDCATGRWYRLEGVGVLNVSELYANLFKSVFPLASIFGDAARLSP
jgi:hypothetical protein